MLLLLLLLPLLFLSSCSCVSVVFELPIFELPQQGCPLCVLLVAVITPSYGRSRDGDA